MRQMQNKYHQIIAKSSKIKAWLDMASLKLEKSFDSLLNSKYFGATARGIDSLFISIGTLSVKLSTKIISKIRPAKGSVAYKHNKARDRRIGLAIVFTVLVFATLSFINQDVKALHTADVTQVSATADTTTTSTSDTLLAGMTTTPNAGNFEVTFTGSMEGTDNESYQYVSLYVNGSQVAHTEREMLTETSINNTSIPVAFTAYVSGVADSQDVEVRWRTTAGTATMHERTLVLRNVAPGNMTQVSATTDTSTTSTTDTQMNTMTTTPGAGDYIVSFSGSWENSATTQEDQYASLYVNGSQVAHTERQMTSDSSTPATSYPVVFTAYVASVGATDVVEVRYRTTTGGTVVVHERTMVLRKVLAADMTQVTATTDATTTSATDVQLTTMTTTPGAGDYIVNFSGSVEGTTGTRQYVSLYVNGAQVAHSERELYSEASIADASMPIAFTAYITNVGASDVVETRWRTSAGTGTMHQRTMNLNKLCEGICEVQTKTASATSGNPSATLDSTPKEGNLLLVMVTHRSASSTPSISGSGWSAPIKYETEIGDLNARRTVAWFWKVAGASEPTTITVTWSPGVSSVGIQIREFTAGSGGEWSYDADNSADNATTAGTSQTSGSVTPLATNSVAIAGYAFRHGDVSGEVSYSNSYVGALTNSSAAGANYLTTDSAYKVLSSTASTSTTASWTTSSLATGSILNFSYTYSTVASSPLLTQEGYIFENADGGLGATFAIGNTEETADPNPSAITVDKPAGIVEGDFMIVIRNTDYLSTEPTLTTLAGWTSIGSAYGATGGTKIQAYYKVAVASEPASYTWAISGTGHQQISIFEVEGVNISDPIDVSAFSADETWDTDLITPSVDPTIDDGILISAVASPSGAVINIPDGMTLINDLNEHTGDALNQSVAYEILESDIATGANTFTQENTRSSGFQMVLNRANYSPGYVEMNAVGERVNTATNTDYNVPTDGIIDIRVDVALNDYENAAGDNLNLFDRYGSTTATQGWRVDWSQTEARLRFGWRDDAQTSIGGTSQPQTGVFQDGKRYQFRVTFDTSGGTDNMEFFSRSDGNITSDTGWTSLGTNTKTATTIQDVTQIVTLGNGVGSENLDGSYYRAIYEIDGTTKLNPNFTTTAQQDTSTQFTDDYSRVWTLQSGATYIEPVIPTGEVTQLAGSEFATGKTLTNVRQGESITLRTQLTNTGAAVSSTEEFALFYDRNDGLWNKVEKQIPLVNSTGSGCADTDWNCTTIDATGSVGYWTDSAIAPDGNVWIVSQDSGAKALNLVRYVGSGGNCDTVGAGSDAWNCEVIDDIAADTGRHPSIAFDNSGEAWIAYYEMDATLLNLRVAKYVGGASGSGCSNTNWTCTTVDATNDVGQYPSIAFDSTNKAWISYAYTTGGDLRVAKYTGTGSESSCAGGSSDWLCTDIDTSSDVGDYSSLAFDSEGVAWIAYKDDDANAIKIAINVGSGGSGCATATWNCSFIHDTSNLGNYGSLAFKPDGTAVVAYREITNEDLLFAEYTGAGTETSCTGGDGNWDCTTVDSTDSVGDMTSLAIDPFGNPWISYYEIDSGTAGCDAGDCNLKVARYVGGTSGTGCASSAWTCTDVATTDDVGLYSSIVFTPNGDAVVSYFDQTGYDLEVVWLNTKAGEIIMTPSVGSSNWDTLSESHADMTSSSDTTNRDDSDCISAGATWNNGIFVEAGNGTKLPIPSGTGTAQCTELAWTIDTSQAVAGETYRFVVATKDAFRSDKGSWRGPITVATDAYPTLSIRDSAEQEYRYSKDSIAMGAGDCTNTDWACWDVSTTGLDGMDTSMAVDQSGDMWISFIDDEFSLAVAKYVGSGGNCDDSAWECTIVDEYVDAVERFNTTAIAVSPDGTIWISYREDLFNGLRVAKYVGSGGTCSSTEWDCSEIELTDRPGDEPEIAFDASGNPWVINYDTTPNYDLHLARYVGGTNGSCGSDSAWDCSIIEIHATIEYGDKPSIASDSTGKMWASYEKTDTGVTTLRVAEYVGSGGTGCNGSNTEWTCTDLDNTSGALMPSMKVDSSDNPIISYYNDASNTLLVAEYVGGGSGSGCTDSNWTCTTIDDTNNVGEESSLAIDSEGNSWIVHRDATNDRLRLAREVGSGGTGCATGITAWKCEDIDYATVESARDMIIAFDMNGLPWVSWQDGDDQLAVYGADLKVSKLKMPINKPSSTVDLKWTSKNAGTGELRYLLSSGVAPYTDPFGTCGGVADYTGYCGLYANDGNYDSLTTQPEESPMYSLATKFTSVSDVPSVSVDFKTDTSPATNNVVLQVYRFGTTNAWETVATYSSAGCSTDNCRLNGQPSGTVSEYFETIDSKYWVYFRVYQADSTSAITFKLDSFRADLVQSFLRHGSVYREESQDPYTW